MFTLMVQAGIVLLSVVASIYCLFPLARRYRLVDMPDERKRHRRPTPLIGGYAVLVGLVLALYFSGLLTSFSWCIFLGAVVVLSVMGTIDDALDVSARMRFLMQGVVVTVALLLGKVAIERLGLLMGDEVVRLGVSGGLVFTLLCALASINAYNMIDGIDGLAALVTVVTLGALSLLAAQAGVGDLALLCGFLVLALAVFLAFNLELPFFRGRKIFLGDAGSTSLGFLMVWLLAVASQGEGILRPITAVWLVGLPIVDMLAVFFRRGFAGKSPIGADRTHIHHLLLARGFSYRRVLILLTAVQTGFVGTAIVGEWLAWSEFAMTVAAILVGVLYFGVSVALAEGATEKGRVTVRSSA